ncbi:arsenic resistance N-acetyltransferase ArsN2 [Burkholderia glumae]|uniref:arsenic resistance N-acetyltransferase ArsN2 n=1 Tax=Burkholderia glumae TaxID=337 RepID=UPI0001A4B8A7|nr:arsenic resistance N-acetyltransferase ArsN2 [Burkholderia glumae]ACR32958.1 arsenate reductase [Burkholderia glumae BGR1]MCQ0034154.1 arsenic resistance N-acetyltransferase ArsN2 [Burkholderia glumae]MCQ0037423.1 arsenic resistance N-acetyltransferase ArsN2 [Burkholderia glumae]QGA41775.1 arsenate reductase (glutaredoxin) [Burkholderia glumae]UVS88641.1 arsenate reductase (glutaredoxin) [Burkholderia glumae]
MSVIIYHNPECGTSRNVLALLGEAGEDLKVVEYLQSPPDRATLERLIADSGMDVRDAMRIKGTPYKELGLGDPSVTASQLIDAMLDHPILINRPFVVTPRGTRLCRPSDAVLDLVESLPDRDVLKEEGVPFIVAREITGGDAGLSTALAHAGLPVDDLAESGRRFFEFTTLGGSRVGYGGFEQYGSDVLIRSVTVEPSWRSKGVGRNLVALLLRHAFDAHARVAWLLTTDAQAFFEKAGFKLSSRDTAPAAILATRQAVELCSATAFLLSRPITL